MDLNQEIHNIARDSVFIEYNLKIAIANYIAKADEKEKMEILEMLKGLEEKKDKYLKDSLMRDDKKFQDFIIMIKSLKGEKLVKEEAESEKKEKAELGKIESEINSMP